MRCLLTLALLTSPLSVAAEGFDGLYYPQGYESWACTEDSIGRDGGTVALQGDQLMGVENTCTLSNPKSVEGMDAMIYDQTCMGEGESYTSRIIIARAYDDGVILLSDGFAAHWSPCQ